MKINITGIGVTLILVGLIGIILASINNWTGITLNYKDPFARILTTLGTLFVVATLLERSLSVFNKILFGDHSVNARNSYRNALTLAKASAMAFGAADRPLVRNLQIARLGLDSENDKKKWLRLCVGFIVSVLMAAAGFQVLANFVQTLPTGNQGKLFTGMDIFLTAGLLAGGAQGIAEIIEIFKRQQDQGESDVDAKKLVAGHLSNDESQNLHSAGIIPGNKESFKFPRNLRAVFGTQAASTDSTWLRGNPITTNDFNPPNPVVESFELLQSSSGLFIGIKGVATSGDEDKYWCVLMKDGTANWTAGEREGASKILTTKSGRWVYKSAPDKGVSLLKPNSDEVVMFFRNLNPSTVQVGKTGNGNALETGRTVSWEVIDN